MTWGERPTESELSAELEALWDEVTSLPEGERRGFLDARVLDPRLRNELEALLADTPRAEVFFAELRAVVREAVQALGQSRPGASAPDDAPEEPQADPLLGHLIGHYRIDATLGVGGMGVVYRAKDTRLERTVALKFLPPHLSGNPEAQQRFLGEARAAAALDHPNICNIHEVGGEEHPFIAIAFYPGETLKRILERGPLPVDVALDYASQIARGLAAAHHHGIVHRDVKPANVIVTTDGVAKLLDFGIASTSVSDASDPGFIPGTISYMSPEQILSRPVDHRTDLWALGVVLYEMCAGARPFVGDSSVATLHAVLHDRLALSPTVRDRVGPDLAAVLDRLVEKDPADRYASADDLIRALDDCAPRTVVPYARSARGWGRGWRRGVGVGFAAVAVGVASLYPALRPRFVAETPMRLSRETTRNSAARDLFDQAEIPARFRNDSVARVSLGLFQRAVQLDPAFAGAHAHLGMMFLRVTPANARSMPPLEQLDSARLHALKAVELDDSLPDAHQILGAVLLRSYEFEEAEAAFGRLLDLDPASTEAYRFLGYLRIFEGRFEDAHAEFQQARRNDPASSDMIMEVARGHLLNDRCDEAFEWLSRLEDVDPPLLAAEYISSQCLVRNGQWEEALSVLRARFGGGSQRLAVIGQVLGRASRTGPEALRAAREEEARAILNTLLERSAVGAASAFDVATAYAGLGELDPAFLWLERAVRERSVGLFIMHPAFEELHRDPRFAAVRKSMGLPPWRPPS